jgi:prepilin peptidase CpaA
MTTPTTIAVATLVFAGLCVANDLRDRRIPNRLSGLGVVAGVALNTACFGTAGLVASLVGLVAIVVLLLAPFALGGLGGGDVKMMGAIGAFLGLAVAAKALLFGAVLGGVLMALHLVRLGRLRATVANVGTMAAASVATRSIDPLRVSADQPGAVTLPYSVPLALGTVAALLFTGGFTL